MKIIPVSFRRGPVIALVATFVLLAGAASANAQTVYLTFTGGGGAPVTVSWSAPITYNLNFTSTGYNPYFVFQSIANASTAFPNTGPLSPVGAPTYTSTGVGSADGTDTINYTNSAAGNHNLVASNDLVFWSTTDTITTTFLTSGDVITLSAGSLMYNPPNGNYSGTMPVSGYYSTIVVDAAYLNPSSPGVSAIPEPSTYAAFAGAAMLGFVAWRRRKASAPKSAA